MALLANLVWGLDDPRSGLVLGVAPMLLLAVPLSIGIAILRYRLFEIDVIIRHTLVYSILTLTLVVVYLGCILVSRAVVAPIVGGSELSIVASTLVIAALFNPLRRRIQSAVLAVIRGMGRSATVPVNRHVMAMVMGSVWCIATPATGRAQLSAPICGCFAVSIRRTSTATSPPTRAF